MEDNGIGFDIEQAQNIGLGLSNIHHLTQSLNGSIKLNSVIGKGTSLSINIPNQGSFSKEEAV